MSVENVLWYEKYRPHTLKDVLLPQRLRNIFNDGITSNVLLYGTQGSGKTTTAKAAIRDFGYDVLELNCSLTTGVDTIRNSIVDFCETQSLLHTDNRIKVVLLDEVDGMSSESYGALRGVIEKYSKHVRFVGTCNFINKIPEPIQSRFDLISFDFEKDEINEVKTQQVYRIYEICKNEGMEISKDAIGAMIRLNFPDMRSMVKKLQLMKRQGIQKIELENVVTYNSKFTSVFDLVLNSIDTIKNYQVIVSEYSNKVDEVLNSLGREFIEYLITKDSEKYADKIPHISIIVAKYQFQKINTIDPVVCLLACIAELQQCVNRN